MKRSIPALLLLIGSACLHSGAAASAPLTTFPSVHALSSQEADPRLPVAFDGNETGATAPAGSHLRTTGVPILDDAIPDDGNPFSGPVAFGILLRTSGDLQLLSRSSLLTVRNLVLVAGVLLALVFLVLVRGWSLERRVRGEMAVAATAERWRSGVLEDINRARPLLETLEKITGLVSYRLHGAPCWCELSDGTILGNRPAPHTAARVKILEQQIPSHTGPVLGTIFAAPGQWNQASSSSADALFSAAQLAALAIETRGLYADLVRRSEFDLLTAVHNRFSLEKRLDRMIEGERRQDGNFGLIYIDLDDFKQVNDQYGHRIGDLYLQEVAQRMKGQLRPSDMLARLGGDEFAVIIQIAPTRAHVVEIAERLKLCFSEPFELDAHVLRGHASFGTALFPDDGSTRDSLLSAADAAMYVAKNSRRNPAGTSAH